MEPANSPSQRRLKIAFHLHHLAVGGVEKMIVVLSRELVRRGHEVELVVNKPGGELHEAVADEVSVIDLNVTRTLKSITALARYLSSNKPDVLISNLSHQNIAAITAKLLSRQKVKVFVTEQNALSRELHAFGTLAYRVVPALYRVLLPAATGVIAVSDGVADDVAQLTGYPRGKIAVIHNASVPGNVSELLAETVDHPFFENGVPVVLGCGRLVAQKRFDVLLHAFAVARKKRDLRLAIVGSGPLREELEALAGSLGIAGDVAFMGFASNPYKYMVRSAVMCLTSDYEGFGNVLVEALASGCQVASFDCRHGPAEILEGGRYGRLTPVGDVDGMARSMVELIDNPIDPVLLRSRAADFSLGPMADRYESLIYDGA